MLSCVEKAIYIWLKSNTSSIQDYIGQKWSSNVVGHLHDLKYQ